MKSFKLLLLAIFFLSSYSSIAQNNKPHTDYISEKAYWEEYVKQTAELKRRLENVVLSTDLIIKVVSKYDKQSKKIQFFYLGGKMIGKMIGNKLHNYHVLKVENRNNKKKPKKSKKRTKNKIGEPYRYTPYYTNKDYSKYQIKPNDKVKSISEKKYWKDYVLKYKKNTRGVKKKKFSRNRITIIKRTVSKKEKVILFYQNRKLVGKIIKGKFYNYLK